MQTWKLYVDESGDFESDGQVAVAAVLLPPTSRLDPERLSLALLNRAAPEVPWPPHAWLLWNPVMLPLWTSLRSTADRPAQQAIRCLQQQGPDELDRSLARLKTGQEPLARDLRRLHEALACCALPEFRRYQARMEAIRESIWQTLWTEAAENGAFLAAASETEPHDAAGEKDRYLLLLEVLLERVAEAVVELRVAEGRPVDERVDLSVLTRDVHCDILGARRRMIPGNVGAVAERATASPQRLREGSVSNGVCRVRLNPGRLGAYGKDACLGYVLADFAANAARRQLCHGKKDLKTAEEDLRKVVRLSTRLGAGRGSQLSASGEARSRLHAAQRGEALSRPWPERARKWAVEQAEDCDGPPVSGPKRDGRRGGAGNSA